MKFIARLFFPVLAIAIAVFIISHGSFTYEDLATELLGAIMFTTMFFFVQNAFAPSVEISPYIAEHTDSNGDKEYVLKFINYSFSGIRDVKISVRRFSSEYTVNGGVNSRVVELLIAPNYVKSIDGIWSALRSETKNNAYQILLPRSIEDLIRDPSKSLEIMVSARDSIVGRERIFIQKYNDLQRDIISGQFKHGLSLKVQKLINDSSQGV